MSWGNPQLDEVLEKLSQTNYKLANELLDMTKELRIERREKDQLRVVNERLNAENARLARQMIELSKSQESET